METKEWALILFTVLSQLAIGAYVFVTWFRQRNQDAARDGVYRKVMLALLPVVAVAILASLLHLGRPLLAVTAIKNLGSSWLSREVFFSAGFFVLALGAVLLEKSPAVRQVLSWLAVLSGIGSVFSMAAIYNLAMMPAWQGYYTYVAFAGTALLLGGFATAGLLLFFGRGGAEFQSDLQMLVWVAVAALLVQAIGYPAYLVSLAGGGKAAQAALKLLSDQYALLLVARWTLVLAGGLVPMVLIARRLAAGKGVANLVYAGLAFVVAGELVGRFLFYASGIRITIGLM